MYIVYVGTYLSLASLSPIFCSSSVSLQLVPFFFAFIIPALSPPNQVSFFGAAYRSVGREPQATCQ